MREWLRLEAHAQPTANEALGFGNIFLLHRISELFVIELGARHRSCHVVEGEHSVRLPDTGDPNGPKIL